VSRRPAEWRRRPGDAFWQSVADHAVAGWVEASPTSSALSELNPSSQSLLNSGAAVSLGALYNPAGTQDLTFEFHIAGNAGSTTGIVMYGSLLSGDFNRDGKVDAGNYVLWRAMNGQQVARGFGADGNGDGMIDNSDYDLWRSNFDIAGSGAGNGLSASVPEPSAALLLIASICGVSAFSRARG
jgi:hypothetical protein